MTADECLRTGNEGAFPEGHQVQFLWEVFHRPWCFGASTSPLPEKPKPEAARFQEDPVPSLWKMGAREWAARARREYAS